ncbi:MAG TPA: YhdH/YhfP family quinone oxidoreductase [Gammaproteobacteria bacterium]|nr:YhdH/YhfP family quinone oxidoreductase [Gammaproteobacteria bacterium]
MQHDTYKALVVEEAADGAYTRGIRTRPVSSLPAGEVLVRVGYSSLNHKDALCASGNKGVTKRYPHTPGIDAAGVVEDSRAAAFRRGDRVIVSGYDLGMNTPGGFGQLIRVPAGWVLPLPAGLTLEQSMALGTAGFTAGMSVYKIIATVAPDQGDILVTGATGGVGSIAAGILCRLGYAVVGMSGKAGAGEFLARLGVTEVIPREQAVQDMERPMLKARWAGVVDTVGGDVLAAAVKATRPLGLVTCCGNVASPRLDLTVYPFILRGVTLAGIDSQNCPMTHRQVIWDRLAGEWRFDALAGLYDTVPLETLGERIDAMLRGALKGRTVVDMGR